MLITYDENGGYPHPDHIRCHEISVAAFDAAGDPDRFPDAGDPWQPLKLYYSHGFSKARHAGLPRGAAGARAGVAVRGVAEQLACRAARPERTGHHPRASAPTGSRRATRRCIAHATQIDPTSRWFFVPLEMQREIWPTEDYELVRCLVDAPVPEDDLFAGIREPVAMRPAV